MQPSGVEKRVLWRVRVLPGVMALCASRFCKGFAGILQLKIRQQVSGVSIFVSVLCEGSVRLLCRAIHGKSGLVRGESLMMPRDDGHVQGSIRKLRDKRDIYDGDQDRLRHDVSDW